MICSRCTWPDRSSSHWPTARKITVRAGRILPNSLSQPANKIWKTSLATAESANCLIVSDRAVVLCKTCR